MKNGEQILHLNDYDNNDNDNNSCLFDCSLVLITYTQSSALSFTIKRLDNVSL